MSNKQKKIYKVYYLILVFIGLQILFFFCSLINFQQKLIVEFISQYVSIAIISIYLLKINNKEKKLFPHITVSIVIIMISHLLERLNYDFSKILMQIGFASLLIFYSLRFYNKMNRNFLDIIKFALIILFCSHRIVFNFFMNNIHFDETLHFSIHYIGIKIILLMLFLVYLFDYLKQKNEGTLQPLKN